MADSSYNSKSGNSGHLLDPLPLSSRRRSKGMTFLMALQVRYELKGVLTSRRSDRERATYSIQQTRSIGKKPKGKERDAYAMRGQRAILLLIRRMKELVLQLSLLGLSPLFLFYPLPGTFPAGQGAPRLHVQGDRNFD